MKRVKKRERRREGKGEREKKRDNFEFHKEISWRVRRKEKEK